MVAQVYTCVHVLYCMYIYPCAVPSLNKDVTYLLTYSVFVNKSLILHTLVCKTKDLQKTLGIWCYHIHFLL